MLKLPFHLGSLYQASTHHLAPRLSFDSKSSHLESNLCQAPSVCSCALQALVQSEPDEPIQQMAAPVADADGTHSMSVMDAVFQVAPGLRWLAPPHFECGVFHDFLVGDSSRASFGYSDLTICTGHYKVTWLNARSPHGARRSHFTCHDRSVPGGRGGLRTLALKHCIQTAGRLDKNRGTPELLNGSDITVCCLYGGDSRFSLF